MATTNRIDETTQDLSNFRLKDYIYENLDYTTDNQGKERHGVFDVWMHNKFSWGSFSEDRAVVIENVVINNVKAVDGAALKNDGLRQTPKMERLFSQTGTLVSGFSPWLNF